MKKLLVLLVMVLLTAGTVSAATQSGLLPPPVPTDTSTSRDAFGYGWADNNGSGGPQFNWIDITSFGIQVNGLGDDNNIGPVQMHFNFPYYWYTVSQMWIGSNGYISFSSSANFAHPFASIPTAGQPNDLVAVLTGDLDFSDVAANPACYYYTNNVDTFIVSWIHVPPFSPPGYDLTDSTHTFQLILSTRDSSLTFQYGENHGNFAESGNLADVIGIENVNGTVGVQYLYNNLPANHMWHDGHVVKFHAIRNPSFVVHDFGIIDGFHTGSGAVFVPNGTAYTLHAKVKDFGNQAENNMKVRCNIKRGTSNVFDDTVLIAHMEPAETLWVTFNRQFTPTRDTTFKATFSTIMSGDQNSNNNTKICELDGFTLPAVLRYTGDIAASGRSWNGDFSGFGNEFQMPVGVEITSASFYVNAVAAPGPGYVWILADNGTGNPDLTNHLFDDTVQVTTAGWVTLSTAGRNLIFAPDAKFWLVGLHAFASTFDFGMDNVTPLSFRGWEYTGGMAPDRDRGVSDIMMRVSAVSASGVSEEITPKSFSLSPNYPNPFNARTNISFTIDRESDVSINIYNIVGQLVQNLPGHYGAGTHLVTWDGSQTASGVYFYKINVGNATETRKMVLLK